jgi:G:T-mismatch repair DNA endonuclease (very short patch repair protein)
VRVPLGLELLRQGFFFRLRALSYISSGILTMSSLDAQIFVVSFYDNEHVCPLLPFPSCSTKLWKWGRRGMRVSDLLPIVPVRS